MGGSMLSSSARETLLTRPIPSYSILLARTDGVTWSAKCCS